MKGVGPKKIYDLYNDHLELYITSLMEQLTPEQKSVIPKALLSKGFMRNGFKAAKLTFGEIMYLLITFFGRQAVILISGNSEEQDLVTMATLKDALKIQRRKIPLHEVSEQMQAHAMFAIGDKQLMESVAYVQMVAHSQLWRSTMSKAYTYPKVGRGTGFKEFRQSYKQMVAVLAKYESLDYQYKAEQQILPALLQPPILYRDSKTLLRYSSETNRRIHEFE